MKHPKMTLTSLAILAALSLSGCGGISGGSAPQEAPKVIASESASPSPSPSPSATETKPPAPPAIKGVATDGKSSFLQTTVDDTDASYEVNLNLVTDTTKSKVSQDELQDAWEVVSKFVTEEGIDSPLRTAGAADNPAVFTKWVAENKDKFVPGTKFLPGEADKGNTVSNTLGISQDRAEWEFSYVNDASKPRVIERDFKQGNVSYSSTDGSLTFNSAVDYTMTVQTPAGETMDVTAAPSFTTTVVKVDGQWKIAKNDATFYSLSILNPDGTKNNLLN